MSGNPAVMVTEIGVVAISVQEVGSHHGVVAPVMEVAEMLVLPALGRGTVQEEGLVGASEVGSVVNRVVVIVGVDLGVDSVRPHEGAIGITGLLVVKTVVGKRPAQAELHGMA